MTAPAPKIFLLLKDPSWDGLKPEKIHLFPKSYATDGSDKLITDVAGEGLEYMRKAMVYDDTYQFFYWTYTPQGSFIDCFVTPDLFADQKAFVDFRVWLTGVITKWADTNNLTVKVENDKARQFFLKFTITVTPIPVVGGGTVSTGTAET